MAGKRKRKASTAFFGTAFIKRRSSAAPRWKAGNRRLMLMMQIGDDNMVMLIWRRGARDDVIERGRRSMVEGRSNPMVGDVQRQHDVGNGMTSTRRYSSPAKIIIIHHVIFRSPAKNRAATSFWSPAIILPPNRLRRNQYSKQYRSSPSAHHHLHFISRQTP